MLTASASRLGKLAATTRSRDFMYAVRLAKTSMREAITSAATRTVATQALASAKKGVRVARAVPVAP